jgi:hypothetical protein
MKAVQLPFRPYELQIFFYLFIAFFTIYSRYLKKVITKRDGCAYIRSRYHPSMVLWSVSNEILWPHSVESSSYFRLTEGLLLVGCCFVQSDFCDSSHMFL